MGDKQKQGTPETMYWIIWGALLFSILIYCLVAFMITSDPTGDPMDSETLTLMTYALGVVSFLILPVLLFLRNLFLSKPIEEGTIKDVRALRTKAFTPYIIFWSLSESVAIYGLLLTILSHEMDYFFGFASVSFLYLIFFRPNLGGLEEEFYRNNPDRRGQ